MKTLLLLFITCTAYGATYSCTSAGTGNWNDATKWTNCNGTFPNNGGGHLYRFTQNHAMTIPAGVSITVGTSPCGTTFTVNATTDLVTSATCSPANGTPLRFWSQGSLPAPLAGNTTYEVCSLSGVTFRVASAGSSCASLIDFTSAGSGTLYFLVQETAGTVGATLTNNGTFTFQGDLLLGNAGLVLGPNAKAVCDSSVSADPTSALYLIGSSNHGQYGNTISTSGATAASPGTLASHASGTPCRTEARGYTVSPMLLANNLNITRFGASWYPAIMFTASGGATLTWNGGRCDACGTLQQSSVGAGSVVNLQNVTFVNTPVGVTQNIYLSGGSGNVANINHNVFDNYAIVNVAGGVSFTNNVSTGQITGGYSGVFTSYDGNFFVHNGNSPVVYAGATTFPSGGTGNYVYQPPVGNPHILNVPGNLPAGANPVFQGWVVDFAGTDTNGDIFLFGNSTNANTLTFKNNLLLPGRATSGKATAGCFLSGQQAATNWTIAVEKNTMVSDGNGDCHAAVVWLETPSGTQRANTFSSVKSNAVYNVYSSSGCLMSPRTGPTVDDAIAAANADYNGAPTSLWNGSPGCAAPIPGSSVNGYGLRLSSGTPGAHDTQESAAFVDFRRNLEAWDASLGGPGTFANAWAQMTKMNDATGFNPRYTVAGLINYVRMGFAPRNLKYATGGHDGGRIGVTQPVLMFGGINQ